MIANKHNILIITHQPFPNGLALTNRIISYAKGFILNDSGIKILIFKPTEPINSVKNELWSSIYSGIPFEYTGKTTIKNNNFLLRRLQNFYAFSRGLFLIIKERRNNDIDTIIVCSISLYFEFSVFILSRILKIKLIKEETEYPEVYFWKKGIIHKIYKYLYIKIVYKLYDGILLITKNLIKYFIENNYKSHKLLHVPMIVEFDRFSNKLTPIRKNANYIAYCGSINCKKDGIDILLKAFSKIADSFPSLNLYLIGNIVENFEDNFNSEILKRTISQLNLNNRVIITGLVNRTEVINLLQNATLLVMSRPKSLQSQGGFPTKLGEYLATSIPIVVTNTGEISDYLTDGENAYIAEPNNIDSFAEKMKYALINYQQSIQIGIKGKDVALTHFNNIVQSKLILSFLDNLLIK